MTKRNRFSFAFNGMTILAALGIAGALIYAAFVAFPFFEGPSLTAFEPQKTERGTILLQGATKRVSALSINDLEVPITDTGLFSVERAYPAGYTVVVFRASDRFGRSREKILTFITPRQ